MLVVVVTAAAAAAAAAVEGKRVVVLEGVEGVEEVWWWSYTWAAAMAPLSSMACLWASSVRSSAKDTVCMQSTGQQSRAWSR